MQPKTTPLLNQCGLPILALLLFLAGALEYPHALEKMHQPAEAWHILKSTAAMILAGGVAFLIGWRAQWLVRLERIPPRYWITAAIALVVIPSLLDWNIAGYLPVWKTGIPGVYVSSSLLSVLAFFGYIASLRYNANREYLPHNWKHSFEFALLGIAWAYAVMYFGLNVFFVITALPVAMMMLRGTPWFRPSIVQAGVCCLGLLAFIVTSDYRRSRFVSVIFPFGDPRGWDYVPFQLRKSLGESGWFGSDSFANIPGAANQFMLSTLGEHFGWIALLLVLCIATLLLLQTRFQLHKLSNGWLQCFALALLGFLIVSNIVNLSANFGLTRPAGLGIPFLSRDWFLAGITAFLIGFTLRNKNTAKSCETTLDAVTATPILSSKRLALQTLAVSGFALLGILVTHEIAHSEMPKPPLPLQARADIVDRHGKLLATNEIRLAVWLDTEKADFSDGRKLAELGKLIDKTPEEIYNRASDHSTSPHLYLAYNLPMALRQKLEALRFPGLHLEEMNTRIHPKKEIAAHVIGFTTADTEAVGIEGVELNFDQRLYARPGKQPIKPLRLFLDAEIQSAAHQSLRASMLKHDARVGAAVVANIKGEILAMVSIPSFDPEDRSAQRWDTTNHAVETHFPMGHLLHPVSRAAAINGGVDETPSRWWLEAKLEELRFIYQPGEEEILGGLHTLDFTGTLVSGLETSLIQLANAYITLTGDGISRIPRIVNDGNDYRSNKQVFNSETVSEIRRELEAMAIKNAAVTGIRTGGAASSIIAHRDNFSPYTVDAYIGVAPINAPKYVVAVMIKRDGDRSMRGHPAALAFAKIMRAAIDGEKKTTP